MDCAMNFLLEDHMAANPITMKMVAQIHNSISNVFPLSSIDKIDPKMKMGETKIMNLIELIRNIPSSLDVLNCQSN